MKSVRNINFFLPYEKKVAGGIKRIIFHAKTINNIDKLISANLLFIKKKTTSKWIDSIKKKIKIKNDYTGWRIKDIKIVEKKNQNFQFLDKKTKIIKKLNFDEKNDFIIFPEIFAHFAEELYTKKKVKYAIMVLNSFSIFPTSDIKKLNKCYRNAEFIISGSKIITKYIKFTFPKIKKIYQSTLSIDKKIYSKNLPKKNLITYMPRKLKDESSLLFLYLKRNLPKNWKILPLDNMTEKEIAFNLNKSKIFLSFSEFEGFGRPPLEAAIAGNKVIGYHGEGGKEFMKEPIFTTIQRGNILEFAKTVIEKIDYKIDKKKQLKQIKQLTYTYSKKNEIRSIKKYLKHIKSY